MLYTQYRLEQELAPTEDKKTHNINKKQENPPYLNYKKAVYFRNFLYNTSNKRQNMPERGKNKIQ